MRVSVAALSPLKVRVQTDEHVELGNEVLTLVFIPIHCIMCILWIL
jgi:hypothetical protein